MKNNSIATFKNAIEVYTYLCQPICKEYGVQQPALDILHFLAENPDKNTAVDIQLREGIKQSMVSFHVERLVNDGYLERLTVPGDRRKVRLVCTEKSAPLVEKCGNVRKKMWSYLSEGISEEEYEVYRKVSKTIEANILACRELMQKGELK